MFSLDNSEIDNFDVHPTWQFEWRSLYNFRAKGMEDMVCKLINSVVEIKF